MSGSGHRWDPRISIMALALIRCLFPLLRSVASYILAWPYIYWPRTIPVLAPSLTTLVHPSCMPVPLRASSMPASLETQNMTNSAVLTLKWP